MAEFVSFFALSFSALFPVINPIGSSLGFLGMVGGAREEDCVEHGSVSSGDRLGRRGGPQALRHFAAGGAACRGTRPGSDGLGTAEPKG